MEVLGPTSVKITWQAPPLEHHNGAIFSYIIRYFPSTFSNKTKDIYITASKDENFLHRILTDLVPFTRYSFQMSAVNAAGAGPFSTVVAVRTEEEGTQVQ